eukprot:4558969-Pyramimonas_sp.AAC.1
MLCAGPVGREVCGRGLVVPTFRTRRGGSLGGAWGPRARRPTEAHNSTAQACPAYNRIPSQIVQALFGIANRRADCTWSLSQNNSPTPRPRAAERTACYCMNSSCFPG